MPQATTDGRRVQRMAGKVDFERVLATRSQSRSAHFALHYLAGTPMVAPGRQKLPESRELSTAPAPACPQLVDDSFTRLWFGCVVPKRHARRAVTRSLLKRQVRSAFQRHGADLPAGLWLLRLRAPFGVAQFVSARSEALASASRAEIDGLLRRAVV